MNTARAGPTASTGDYPFVGEAGIRHVASAACQRILHLFEVDGASVLLVQQGATQLVAEAGDVASSPMDQPSVRALIEQTLVSGRAGRTEAHADGACPTIATPLSRDGVQIGVILIWRPRTRPFSDNELAQSALLAESLGMTLQLHQIGETLRRSEAQYRLLFQRNPLPMYVSAFEDRRILAANPAALRLYEYDEPTFLSMTSGHLIYHPVASERERIMRETGQQHRIRGLVGQQQSSTGRVIDVEVWTDEIQFEGRLARLVLIYDITERRRAERELTRLSRAQRMLSACNEALARSEDESDLLGRICNIALNEGGYLRAVVGFVCHDEGRSIRVADWRGQPNDDLLRLQVSWDPDRPGGRGPMARAIRSGEPVVLSDISQHLDVLQLGTTSLAMGYRSQVVLPLREAGQTFGAINLLGGEVLNMGASELALLMELADNLAYGIVYHRARAQRQLDEHRIAQLAYFDELTGLPNRAQLHERLQASLTRADQHKWWGALMLIDVRNLKTLNEVWGHEEGDRLLRSLAQRLQTHSPGFVARMGADEFVVLLEQLGAAEEDAGPQAASAAQALMAALAHRHLGEGVEFDCATSAGLVNFNGRNGGVSELLQRAEIALYAAKTDGPQSLRPYDRELHAAVVERATLDKQLRDALEERQFELHYQPQVRADGTWMGAEALVRWHHPLRGMVSPALFVPMCEENGLIVALGQQVLAMACATLADWRSDPQLEHLVVAVNVSARELRQPDFVRQVSQLITSSGAPAHRLKLELTESVMVDDVENVIGKLMALRRFGVRFSMDDFGTGFSSLSQLKRLPLDQLKIDQSFVRDLLTDANDAVIVRAVIALGHSLGLEVIAEGVETAEQQAILASHGCDAYQGYLLGKPMPRAMLETLLRQPTPVG